MKDKDPELNDGRTPLHLAANGGKLEVCKLFIEKGAKRNYR